MAVQRLGNVSNIQNDLKLETRWENRIGEYDAAIDAADTVNKLRGCVKDLARATKALHKMIRKLQDGE